jgi:hypothetical protein
MRQIIPSNKSLWKIFPRLLRNNHALQRALSGLQRKRRASEGDLEPGKALEVMHFLAIQFAVTRASTERMSFKMTYWCYRFMLKCGGPIKVPIIRALWHAGYERYQSKSNLDDMTSSQRWPCSRSQLEWLLSKVWEVEGQDAAKQLLHSFALRRARAEALERVAHEMPLTESTEQDAEAASTETALDAIFNVYSEPTSKASSGTFNDSLDDIERNAMDLVAEQHQERARRQNAFGVMAELEPPGEFESELMDEAESGEMEDEKFEKLFEIDWAPQGWPFRGPGDSPYDTLTSRVSDEIDAGVESVDVQADEKGPDADFVCLWPNTTGVGSGTVPSRPDMTAAAD